MEERELHINITYFAGTDSLAIELVDRGECKRIGSVMLRLQYMSEQDAAKAIVDSIGGAVAAYVLQVRLLAMDNHSRDTVAGVKQDES